MYDYKRKPKLKIDDLEAKEYLENLSELDAKRYGYLKLDKGSKTYYYHKKDDYLEIYNHNEKLMQLAKNLSNCLFDMEKAIEIDYNVTASDILERETLGQSKRDIAWYMYRLRIDEDINKVETWISHSEEKLLINNKILLQGENLITGMCEKYNLAFEKTRFYPFGIVGYDPKLDRVINVNPENLSIKEVKQMIKELNEADKLKS